MVKQIKLEKTSTVKYYTTLTTWLCKIVQYLKKK